MTVRTSENTKIGIIGAGNVVTTIHLPVLLALDAVEVSWIADKNAKRAQQVADAHGIPAAGLAQGAESIPEADVVLLAIPYGVRAPYYERLAARSIAVYAEKPFARTAVEHAELCDLFASHRLACGLNRRAMGVVGVCREVIATGLFGALRRARFGQGNLGGITTGAGFAGDVAISGGGPLLETGVHGIDTVFYCLGAESVRLRSGRIVMDEGLDLHAEGMFEVVDSRGDTIPFEVEVSRLRNTINRIEFEFEQATVYFSIFSLSGLDNLHVQPHGSNAGYTLMNSRNNFPRTWNQVGAAFWEAFLGGVSAGEANYTAAGDSVLTTQAVEMLYALTRRPSPQDTLAPAGLA